MIKSMNFPKELPQRRKTPSFSSILLDSINHSVDETRGVEETNTHFIRKDNVLVDEQDVKSLRRAIMLEKWMEQHSSDSSIEHASRCTPKSLSSSSSSPSKTKRLERTQNGVHESHFTRTKSRVLKIYGDLKKVKQPMSPGTKIANFLNSVFNSRNLKKHHQQIQHQSSSSEGWSSMRKSRSVKYPTIFSSLTSKSCLSKAPSSRTKSKRSVRFGPVSVIEQYDPRISAMPKIGSNFIRENIYNFPSFQEMKPEKYNSRDVFSQEDSEDDDDIRSCTSSDLFELENISVVGNQMHREELPVFGTTNVKINQAIVNGLSI